ncbi:hypothetical protein J3E69DRAFT_340531 [Trichoderma sp. SZMC 28015]
MDESKLHERIRLAIDEFLLSENTTTEAKEALLRYAQARPHRANPDPIIHPDEINTRLEMITKLEKTNGTSTSVFQRSANRDFQFTRLQLSYLMLIPLECLRRFSEDTCILCHPYHIMDTYISFMVRGRMPGDIPTHEQTIPEASAGSSQSGSNWHGNSIHGSSRRGSSHDGTDITAIKPNAKEHDKCFARDGGVCILTGAAYPEVCHIIPFAITASAASIIQCRFYIPAVQSLLGHEDAASLRDLLRLPPGSSDESWNMLCLHPTLRDWWDKCFFGFKFHRIIPSLNEENCTIQLQFHWLPRNGSNPEERTKADKEAITRMLQKIQQDEGLIMESRKENCRPIETGDVFSLVMTEEDAAGMKVMIDIQWANAKLAAISGAADF